MNMGSIVMYYNEVLERCSLLAFDVVDVDLSDETPLISYVLPSSEGCIFFFFFGGGRLGTCDNLMYRGIVMAGWCCLYKHNGEMVDHLLFHCSVVVEIWNFFFCSFAVVWVIPACVMDLLAGWRNWIRKHSSDIWNLVPLCVWSIWRERNILTFENLERSVSQLLELCTRSLFNWCKVWGLTTTSSVGEFPESLNSLTSIILCSSFSYRVHKVSYFVVFLATVCSYFMHTG